MAWGMNRHSQCGGAPGRCRVPPACVVAVVQSGCCEVTRSVRSCVDMRAADDLEIVDVALGCAVVPAVAAPARLSGGTTLWCGRLVVLCSHGALPLAGD